MKNSRYIRRILNVPDPVERREESPAELAEYRARVHARAGLNDPAVFDALLSGNAVEEDAAVNDPVILDALAVDVNEEQ